MTDDVNSLLFSEHLSKLIGRLRVFAILGVVFIHAPKTGGDALYIDLFSRSLPSACVPLFFFLSGMFLLGKSVDQPIIYFREIRKRINSLLIPFLVWNAMVLVFAILLLSYSPSLSNGGGYTLPNISPISVFSALIGWERYPIHYQFWFLRNLIVLVVASPLLRILILWCPWIALPFIFLLESHFSGIGYFFVGGIFACCRWTDFLDLKHPKIHATIALMTLIVSVWLTLPWLLIISVSFVFLLGLANIRFGQWAESLLLHLEPDVFFVFAAHEPLMTVMTRIIGRTLNRNHEFNGLTYFLVPIFVVLICVASSRLLRRFIPKTYRILTGNR